MRLSENKKILLKVDNVDINADGSFTIPDTVILIGREAFYERRGLKSIIIPNSVILIETYAFFGCRDLISITISNSVISIGASAFCDCAGLKSITLSNSVISIGVKAFYGTSGLKFIIIDCLNEEEFTRIRALLPLDLQRKAKAISYELYSIRQQIQEEVLKELRSCSIISHLAGFRKINYDVAAEVNNFEKESMIPAYSDIKNKILNEPKPINAEELPDYNKRLFKIVHKEILVIYLKRYLAIAEKEIPVKITTQLTKKQKDILDRLEGIRIILHGLEAQVKVQVTQTQVALVQKVISEARCLPVALSNIELFEPWVQIIPDAMPSSFFSRTKEDGDSRANNLSCSIP